MWILNIVLVRNIEQTTNVLNLLKLNFLQRTKHAIIAINIFMNMAFLGSSPTILLISDKRIGNPNGKETDFVSEK